jgi:hypothetical protein
MLWLAARAGVDRKLVVLASCACARTALHHVPAHQTRPLRAIESAEDWARGGATTLDEVRLAAADANAAYAADANAAYAAAANAAYAAYAADAANAAALAANAANAAALAAADAANAAALAAAHAAAADALADMALLVRKHIPWRVLKAAIVAKGLLPAAAEAQP